MMNKALRILLPIVLVITITGASIISCNTAKPLQIGMIGTMSGPSADMASQGRRGFELAVDRINQDGGIHGREIQLIVKDSLNDREVTQSIISELEGDGIRIIVGDYTSTLTETALHAISDDTLLVSPTASSVDLNDMDDQLIRFNASSDQEALVLAAQIQAVGSRNLVIIQDQNNITYVNALSNGLESTLHDTDTVIQDIISFNSSGRFNPRDIVRQIIDAGYPVDATLVLADSETSARLIQAQRELGLDFPIYTTIWTFTADFFDLGYVYNENVYAISLHNIYSETPAYLRFVDEYREKFGEDPSFSSVLAYDAAMGLFRAMSQSKSLQAKDVRNALLAIESFDGLQNPFVINEYGDCTRPYTTYVIQDGQLIVMDIQP